MGVIAPVDASRTAVDTVRKAILILVTTTQCRIETHVHISCLENIVLLYVRYAYPTMCVCVCV